MARLGIEALAGRVVDAGVAALDDDRVTRVVIRARGDREAVPFVVEVVEQVRTHRVDADPWPAVGLVGVAVGLMPLDRGVKRRQDAVDVLVCGRRVHVLEGLHV